MCHLQPFWRLTDHVVHTLQIIILVLSQDEALAKTVHKVSAGAVPWYTERTLQNVTVGSLLFAVLLRTAHKNFVGLRDVYLHSNTLAALANLAPHAVGLAPHATHRLVALVHVGGRRLRWLRGPRVCSPPCGCAQGVHQCLSRQLQCPRLLPAGPCHQAHSRTPAKAAGLRTCRPHCSSEVLLPPSLFCSSRRSFVVQAGSDMSAEAAATEAKLVEDFLRALLEVVDSLLFYRLSKNLELVYSLLQQQAVVWSLAEEEAWAAPLRNACTVIRHFNAAIDAAQDGRATADEGSLVESFEFDTSQRLSDEPVAATAEAVTPARRLSAGGAVSGDWSVDRVRSIITSQLLKWRSSALVPVPELRFTYEEATGAQDFFLPYLWRLIADSPHVALARRGGSVST